MKHTGRAPLRSGALTLLITVCAVCLAVLAMLALATARADLALAERGAERLARVTAADNMGQQWLAELDAALARDPTGAAGLPEGAWLENGAVTARLDCPDAGVLQVEVQLCGEGWRVSGWQLQRAWQPQELLDVWQGPARQGGE